MNGGWAPVDASTLLPPSTPEHVVSLFFDVSDGDPIALRRLSSGMTESADLTVRDLCRAALFAVTPPDVDVDPDCVATPVLERRVSDGRLRLRRPNGGWRMILPATKGFRAPSFRAGVHGGSLRGRMTGVVGRIPRIDG